MNKKLVGIIIVLLLIVVVGVVTLFIMNDYKEKDNSNDSSNTQEEKEESDTPTNKKILVVYFSATNNTERVAKIISQNLNADLFEVEPVLEYTSDDLSYSDDNSRVYKEYRDESLRNVELKTTTVPNWEEYDTVLIGYPIWWGIAAWPINNFVKNNDFTGKTVYPFCTSASSGLGESAELLSQLTTTGSWQEGMRFSSSANEEEINNWTNDINK